MDIPHIWPTTVAYCRYCLVLQVERVGRILNISRPSGRIWLCQALVNIVKYLTWAVTQAPNLTERVILYQPNERPNATRITINGTAAVKEISNSDAFYSQFGNSFEAIKVNFQHCTVWANKCLLTLFIQNEDNAYFC